MLKFVADNKGVYLNILYTSFILSLVLLLMQNHSQTCGILKYCERVKPLLPNVRIYAYAYKKRISVNTDLRIYAE